ncbi:helix-turn-helix domain-containing protein, partial [Leuconostoc mesenteroides]|uniref:helix-turn-helix domain-containing protein n=1 Tax=Leuconostoc mesenteroides TaxID=1245 RepID=UPI000A0B9C2F
MSSLSSDERTVIQTLLELNFSIRGIARFLNRSPATISVEIRQVTPYNAKQAHQFLRTMSSLSSDERTVIQTLLELNFSIRGIARFLNRSPATISVEIRQVTPYNAK